MVSMQDLPPGVAYVIRSLPQITLPPLYAVAACYVVKIVSGVTVPTFLVVLACIVSWPVAFIASLQLESYRVAREAEAAGARLPPLVKSDRIGGRDLVDVMIKDQESKFLGHRYSTWMQEYGNTYNMRALFQDRYITSEPEHIKRILATEFDNYEKGRNQAKLWKALLGTGVFTSDGEMWKFHRGMTRQFFSKDRIAHYDIFDRHAQDTLSLMWTRLAEGQPVDWQELIARFTLDSATEFLFGQDVRSLDATLPYPPTSGKNIVGEVPLTNQFSEDFKKAQIATANRAQYAFLWPLWEFWHDKVSDHTKSINEFIGGLCEGAIARKNEREKAGLTEDAEKEEETLLEHLVKKTDDVQLIRDETLNVLLAGRDTTAIVLTLAVYKLAERPDIMERLRAEIADRVGMRQPTYEDIKEMKYLRAFINELLRLYPPVPFNVRHATTGTTWPSPNPGEKPFYVPAGTRVIYTPLIMHRRKDVWGPDAMQFDPDRFLDSRLKKYLMKNPFIFVPFNAGPRICLGQQFAYNEASFMLIRLLQQVGRIHLTQEVNPDAVPPPGYFDSPPCEEPEKIYLRNHITAYVQGGLWVKMDRQPLE